MPSILASATAARPFAKPAGVGVGVVGMALLYVGSTLPSALYPLYERDFGFSELMVTAIYASYMIGNLAVLFVLGRLSDQLGRRPAALIAFGILLASMLCFLAAQSTAWLFVGRILNGVAVGLGAGTLTAWIAELEPSRDKGRAATVATAGNMAGLGFGPLLAGLLGQYAPWPLRTSYLVYLAILLTAMALLRHMKEGVAHPVSSLGEVTLKPRIGVPKELRLRFVSPAAMAFAMFALGGFYAALAPGLLSRRLDVDNLAAIGAVLALYFGSGAVAAATTGHVRNRTAMLLSTVFLLAGLALLLLADQRKSMDWLLAASVVSGTAMALGFRCSLGMVNLMAPADQRAEVISAYLLVCYTANSLPVIGVGLLSRVVGGQTADLAFAALLAALAIAACAVGWRFEAAERR